MTAKQARWAAQHDWYTSAIKLGVNNYQVVVSDTMESTEVTFTSFKLLRIWAGY